MGRYYTQFFLLSKNELPLDIPAMVKFSFKPLNPFRGWVMRCMSPARCIINKKGLVRINFIQLIEMLNSLICHCCR